MADEVQYSNEEADQTKLVNTHSCYCTDDGKVGFCTKLVLVCVFVCDMCEKLYHTPGWVRPGVLFFFETDRPLIVPLRTPRASPFDKKINFAPRGVLNGHYDS